MRWIHDCGFLSYIYKKPSVHCLLPHPLSLFFVLQPSVHPFCPTPNLSLSFYKYLDAWRNSLQEVYRNTTKLHQSIPMHIQALYKILWKNLLQLSTRTKTGFLSPSVNHGQMQKAAKTASVQVNGNCACLWETMRIAQVCFLLLGKRLTHSAKTTSVFSPRRCSNQSSGTY